MVRTARSKQERVDCQVNAGSLRVGAWITGTSATVLLAYGAMANSVIGRSFGFAASAICALIAVHSIVASLDRRTLLSIGPAGIMYRHFSSKTIPWQDITAVTYYRHTISSMHLTSLDVVCFSVANLAAYPKSPLRWLSRHLQRASGRPPITIQLWFVEASSKQIVDAIRRNWHGRVDEVLLGASYGSKRPRT